MRAYMLFLLLLCNITLFSQNWISFDDSENISKPSFYISKSNSQELIFTVKIFGFLKNEVSIRNVVYDDISLPNNQTLMEVGKPALPVITKLIGVPSESGLKISIIDSTWEELSGYNIIPYQESLLETEQTIDYNMDKEFYSSSEKYPEKISRYSELMNWRGVNNRNLIFCPFRWHPQKQILEVMTEFTVKINFTNSVSKTFSPKMLSTRDRKAFENLIFNYDSVGIASFYNKSQTHDVDIKSIATSTNYKYLIISSPAYINSMPLRALKDWKSRIGLKCKIVSTTTTGSTASDIKSYITDEYIEHGIEYVLFVGDHVDIPLFRWGGGYIGYSDYWYGCVSPGGSSDYHAEISIGRFSISNLTELENMVNKTISYEKIPPVNNWLEKSLLVAHMQDAPGKYQGCKEEIRNATYTITTPTFDVAYGAHTSQSGNDAINQTVINAINDGRGLVNYRGHGSVTGWSYSWSYDNNEFNLDEINSLTNSTETPIIFSIACSNGAIQTSSNCLLENFTRGSNGAVAFLGATRTSATDPNHTLDKEIYRHIYSEGIYNIGEVFIEANIQTMSNHCYSAASILNAKIYIWGGDPSLKIWTDTPSQFTNVTILDNGIDITVSTGGVNGCDIIVCSALDDGGSFHDVAEGVSSSTFYSVARPYYVTVMKHNYIPYLSDVYIQNKTLSSDAFITGRDIYVGSSVTSNESSGQVLIDSGANIFFNAQNDVMFDGLFESEMGGVLEILK